MGSGTYNYRVAEGWLRRPQNWEWGWISAAACDSRDRVYVYSRSDHPLVVLDRDGGFLTTWGDGILKSAHGITIDTVDSVYCTDHEAHCVYKVNRDGELMMTLGTPGRPAVRQGDPFNQPTDLAIG